MSKRVLTTFKEKKNQHLQKRRKNWPSFFFHNRLTLCQRYKTYFPLRQNKLGCLNLAIFSGKSNF